MPPISQNIYSIPEENEEAMRTQRSSRYRAEETTTKITTNVPERDSLGEQ